MIPVSEPATHDPDHFESETGDAQLCCYAHGKRYSAHHGVLATVYAEEYLCDWHWLRCDDCGTGIFYGLTWVGCTKCMAAEFKRNCN